MKRPTRGQSIGGAVAAGALVVGGFIGAAVAPENGPPQGTATGTLLVAVPMGGNVPLYASVQTPTGPVSIDVTDETQAQVLALSGDEVRVTGDKQDDGDLTATNVAPVTAKAPALPVVKPVNIAVVLMRAAGTASPWTAAQVDAQVTQPAIAYFTGVSGGQVQATGRTFGLYQSTLPAGDCSLADWVNAATQAATPDGYTTSTYTQIEVVANTANCPFGGIGYVGASGALITTPTISTGVHELGHNFGLWHAGGYYYPQTAPTTPTVTDYGDPTDVMGSGGARPFGAWHKWKLGWLPDSEVRTVTGTETVPLTANENPTAGGIEMIRVGPYSVERRLPVGYDAPNIGGSTTGVSGVFIHKIEYARTDDVTLLPMPDGLTKPLGVGQSFTDGTVTVKVIANDPAAATASVQVCATTCGAPPSTTTSLVPTSTTIGTSTTTTLPPGAAIGYTTGDDSNGSGGYASFRLGQTFTPAANTAVVAADALIFRKGNVGVATCAIMSTAAGLPKATLAVGTVQFTPTPTATWMRCPLGQSVILTGGVQYALVLNWSGGNGSNALYWRGDATSPTFAGGNALRSRSSGAWDATSPIPTRDQMFLLS